MTILNHWYTGQVTEIEAPVSERCAQGYKVSFSLKVYKPDAIAARKINLRHEGKLIRTFYTYSEDIELLNLILPDSMVENGHIKLYFTTDVEYKPSDYSDQKDQRSLFIFIKRINVQINSLTDQARRAYLESGRSLSKELFSFCDGDPWKEAPELAMRLQQAISDKTPFSLVRFGDGEGRILGYPEAFDLTALNHQVLSYQFGDGVFEALEEEYPEDSRENAVLDLKSMLIDSMCSADIIGLPSWLHFRSDVTQDNINGLIGQAACLKSFSKYRTFPEKYICDHYIFHQFQYLSLFDKLLNELKFVGLVSHTDISKDLEEIFSIKSSAFYEIPGHKTFMDTGGLHFPHVYKEIIKSIIVPFEGAVFLVAAGYLAKVYCAAIKQKGGIAIDIGSVFDGWTGIGRTNVTHNEKLRLIK